MSAKSPAPAAPAQPEPAAKPAPAAAQPQTSTPSASPQKDTTAEAPSTKADATTAPKSQAAAPETPPAEAKTKTRLDDIGSTGKFAALWQQVVHFLTISWAALNRTVRGMARAAHRAWHSADPNSPEAPTPAAESPAADSTATGEAQEADLQVLPPENPAEKATRKLVVAFRQLTTPSATATRSLAPRGTTQLELSPIGTGAPRPPFIQRHRRFLLVVALPTLLAAFYFIFLASNIYVSESRFVVRTPNQQSAGGLGGVLQGAGFRGVGSANEDTYTVSQYIMSRDALTLLDEQVDLRATWGSGKVDRLRRFNPLGWNDTREALFEYYPRRVDVVVEPGSGITTLTVSVFSPDQAVQINEILLGEAEKLVNLLNDRARNDLIRFAENEVRLAEEKAKDAALAVSNYRNTQAVVDPEKQTELHFQHISRLQEELMRTESQLTQLRVFAPESPHPPALELRAETLRGEIAKEMAKITGGENSLASLAATYERLALERQFADQQLASALASLEIARNEAQRQQLYLETISRPSRPDGPLYPRRLRGIFTTFVLGLVAWGILSMLIAGVREHQQ